MDEECTETVCSALDDIRPYNFEPLIRNRDQLNVSDSESSEIEFEEENVGNQDNTRTDNLAWCDCENCVMMEKEEECLCCHELAQVIEKIDSKNLKCITQHEGFRGNCLNVDVLEVSLYEFVERDGPIDDNEPIHELYRYLAYRRFTRWIWHILGKNRRKVIPACAVKTIRDTFPSESYVGFKYPRP